MFHFFGVHQKSLKLDDVALDLASEICFRTFLLASWSYCNFVPSFTSESYVSLRWPVSIYSGVPCRVPGSIDTIKFYKLFW